MSISNVKSMEVEGGWYDMLLINDITCSQIQKWKWNTQNYSTLIEFDLHEKIGGVLNQENYNYALITKAAGVGLLVSWLSAIDTC